MKEVWKAYVNIINDASFGALVWGSALEEALLDVRKLIEVNDGNPPAKDICEKALQAVEILCTCLANQQNVGLTDELTLADKIDRLWKHFHTAQDNNGLHLCEYASMIRILGSDVSDPNKPDIQYSGFDALAATSSLLSVLQLALGMQPPVVRIDY